MRERFSPSDLVHESELVKLAGRLTRSSFRAAGAAIATCGVAWPLLTLTPPVSAAPFGAAKGLTASVLETGDARLLRAADGFKVANVEGPGGLPLPVTIQLPANALTTYSFLMFRNMPAKFALSAGFRVKDYWAVSLSEVADLKLIPTEGYDGAFTLEVLLVKSMGADAERRIVSVAIGSGSAAPEVAAGDDSNKVFTASSADDTVSALPAPEAPVPVTHEAALPAAEAPMTPAEPPAPPAAAQPQGAAKEAAAPRPSQDLTEVEQIMMDRGDTFWKQGDVAAARLLYRPLAKKGIAAAALALARTYDPQTLAALAVQGLQPDLVQAKSWYRMAEELGSAQAAQRLAALDGQPN